MSQAEPFLAQLRGSFVTEVSEMLARCLPGCCLGKSPNVATASRQETSGGRVVREKHEPRPQAGPGAPSQRREVSGRSRFASQQRHALPAPQFPPAAEPPRNTVVLGGQWAAWSRGVGPRSGSPVLLRRARLGHGRLVDAAVAERLEQGFVRGAHVYALAPGPAAVRVVAGDTSVRRELAMSRLRIV
jgi:hypothetical protein